MKLAEKLAVRRQFEHAVQARNETRDKLFDILQSQSGYSKAAEYANKKIKEMRQRISKLVWLTKFLALLPECLETCIQRVIQR